MIYVFYTLAVVLIWFSYRSFRGGIDYFRYFKQELAKSPSNYTPFTTIIAPCKGLDEGLEENLRALLEQDYPDYEVIFVVDDENDPAFAMIERLLNRRDAETPRKEGIDEQESNKISGEKTSASLRLGGEKTLAVKTVVAPKAVDSSQKVENLRAAVSHADKRSKAFVFVDSDARTSDDWLQNLIAPLADENVGAATGYRWFISKTPSFACELRSMWNASIASALGANTASNFCWGGSMAIHRDTFERLDIRGQWQGTLSDDFTVTRTMNAAGLNIYFVPQALTPSIEDCSPHEMLEFTNRQMKITRVYAPKLWLMSFVGSGLFNAVIVTAFLVVILSSRNSFSVWFSVVVLTLVSIFSVAKSTLRLRAVRLILTKHKTETSKQYLYQCVLWSLTPALFFVNCVTALFSRRINWRGTTYDMDSPTKTTILTRQHDDEI